MPAPGPRNLITDVAGLKVGHATDDAVRTGVTVLLCSGGWTAAVDIRGGGPATRETDALALENLVGQAHAICLSGGSVFGLAAADGVTAALSAKDEGLRLSPITPGIPIVPAASLHDLANGGDKAWGLEPPYRRLGLAAVDAAGGEFALGAVGAGRGAMAGTRPGGIGSASLDLGDGLIIGALAAVNPVGTVYTEDGVSFLAAPYELEGELGGRGVCSTPFDGAPIPPLTKLAPGLGVQPRTNTTLCVIAVSAELTRAECKRIAMMAEDGLARAIRPAHTPFDGDIVFCVAKGAPLAMEGPRERSIAVIGSAAADTLARAIARGAYGAEVTSPA